MAHTSPATKKVPALYVAAVQSEIVHRASAARFWVELSEKLKRTKERADARRASR